MAKGSHAILLQSVPAECGDGHEVSSSPSSLHAIDEIALRHLKTYPILAASGVLGPKLAEGDQQVPEGLYRIESLNPNSAFHLALRVNYPNDFDRRKGGLDGRKNLGSDIMIHGSAVSIGCLAMGDEAAEELFVLAARTGLQNISVILSPVDFRARALPSMAAKAPFGQPSCTLQSGLS